jgi:two-component system chemotaxis response regulator CheB
MSNAPGWQSKVGAIAIGASAGGVEALTRLLPALRADLPMPVFIVLHLPRARPSLLAEIFKNQCALRTTEAQDKEPVVPGTVYFAPPDYHLLVDKGPRLALSVDEPLFYSRPAIDVLFESAADIYGPRLLGIILTGGNADGAEGLAAVRREGGTTIVQLPRSAQAAAMPQAALDKGPADFILDLDEMADMLASI